MAELEFNLELSDKRKCPVAEVNAFVRSTGNYIAITAGHAMVHKRLVQPMNGLREFLQVKRKRIPGNMLFEADRLECQFVAGYDPSFDGDPPRVSKLCPWRSLPSTSSVDPS